MIIRDVRIPERELLVALLDREIAEMQIQDAYTVGKSEGLHLAWGIRAKLREANPLDHG